MVYFDSRDTVNFASFRNFDCRRIKLINLDRAALSISYSHKHRYQTLRSQPVSELHKMASEALVAARKAEAVGQPVGKLTIA